MFSHLKTFTLFFFLSSFIVSVQKMPLTFIKYRNMKKHEMNSAELVKEKFNNNLSRINTSFKSQQ